VCSGEAAECRVPIAESAASPVRPLPFSPGLLQASSAVTGCEHTNRFESWRASMGHSLDTSASRARLSPARLACWKAQSTRQQTNDERPERGGGEEVAADTSPYGFSPESETRERVVGLSLAPHMTAAE